MKLFAIICTRDSNLSEITSNLVSTLSSYKVDVKLLVNQNSIFEAYEKGLNLCKANPKDIIIFCHDDLILKSTEAQFIAAIGKCAYKKVGIVGPAGTTFLDKDAVWWNHDKWHAGYHRGVVAHHNAENDSVHSTNYGPHGQVVALDGLFLAARKEVWEEVGLQKPSYFEGQWDFYDIHYTTKSHILGYKNYTIPLNIVHYSGGDLVGRDSWHKNRMSFIANTQLPIIV